MSGEELPLRCTECGAEVESTIKGTYGPAVDVVPTQLDERYTHGWCSFQRKAVVAVRAATWRDAKRERPTAPADTGQQERFGL